MHFVLAALLVVISSLQCMVDAQVAGMGAPVLPDVLTTLLDAYKPLLAVYAQTNIPKTIGNCKDPKAPAPCTDIGNLYEDKKTFYHVNARWITGLNSIQLKDIAMDFDSTGAMTLKLSVYFAQLPASLLVEACAGTLGCTPFLDNTKTCCGSNKTVTLTARAKCSESFPFINSFAITDATITPGINLEVDVFGHTFQVADVTPSIIEGLKSSVGAYIATQGMELFNKQIKELFGTKIYCTRASRDNQEPSSAPVTMPPTMTPVPDIPSPQPTPRPSSQVPSETPAPTPSPSSVSNSTLNSTAPSSTRAPLDNITDATNGPTKLPTTTSPNPSPPKASHASSRIYLSFAFSWLLLVL